MFKLDENAVAVPFSDMDLRIGQRIQLLFEDPSPHKHYSRLVGYVDHKFVMVQIPQENGWNVALREGQSVQVRLFSSVSIYSFECRVQTLLFQPRDHMLLTFPEQTFETRLRSHARVTANLPVQVLSNSQSGQPAAGFQLLDLSHGGASLSGPVALGEVGSTVRFKLTFVLQSIGSTEELEIDALLQSVEKTASKMGHEGYKHGLRFEQVDPKLILLIYELQQTK
jgi:c-di-GMP-binding flagellar brake protein YcgR